MGELDTDSNDRPIYPPSILSIEILANPFEDIIPRQKIPIFPSSDEASKEKQKKPKTKAKK